ncbi:MAG: hypothetical protein AB8E15_02625 [Bdellovibrionales bacterium]
MKKAILVIVTIFGINAFMNVSVVEETADNNKMYLSKVDQTETSKDIMVRQQKSKLVKKRGIASTKSVIRAVKDSTNDELGSLLDSDFDSAGYNKEVEQEIRAESLKLAKQVDKKDI